MAYSLAEINGYLRSRLDIQSSAVLKVRVVRGGRVLSVVYRAGRDGVRFSRFVSRHGVDEYLSERDRGFQVVNEQRIARFNDAGMRVTASVRNGCKLRDVQNRGSSAYYSNYWGLSAEVFTQRLPDGSVMSVSID
ncbi:MAG: hypothetical protein AAFY20_19000 [Cyanobacteria bacterium J06639_14]